ncbi:MAG TPA: hypothetical protein VD837_20090 [Terriglobales bacterium]|nr:hypothetical protein [Terriglobales bacterium]
MSKTLFLFAVLFCSISLLAGDATTPKAEVFGGYSYLRSSGNGFNGWEGQVTGWLSPYLGITGDFSGHYRSTDFTEPTTGVSVSADQNLHTFLAGPTLAGRFGNHAVFGHALFGAARYSVSGNVDIPIVGGISTGIDSATKFAMVFGGGFDLGISPRFAIRPAQLDYLYTRFNNLEAIGAGFSTTNGHQNSFRYSAGVVFRFGGD